mmetsp:Transcript_17658/g.55272  ORF Transcript_17658/g.55272 Transcript_17658/m.55272 type:complete len:173 (+) Transcript_17658:1600-2118(+)
MCGYSPIIPSIIAQVLDESPLLHDGGSGTLAVDGSLSLASTEWRSEHTAMLNVSFPRQASSFNQLIIDGDASGNHVYTSGQDDADGSGDFMHGTTWTFDDGHEVVLKSESYIRREIDARCAQDARECEAIFDDLENLMKQRGGEWDFKKNRDVHIDASSSGQRGAVREARDP